MALSQSSVVRLAGVLSPEFNKFLSEEYSDRLNEVLADAANEFLDRELGEVDDDLFYDLALYLMDLAAL